MGESGKNSELVATIAVANEALLATQVGINSTPRPAPRAPRPLRIGRYLIVEELGRGGMGVVYAAYPDVDL